MVEVYEAGRLSRLEKKKVNKQMRKLALQDCLFIDIKA